VAVPSSQTQNVIDRLVECGVRAILNYAPITPRVPLGVKIRNIDPVISLQSMTYYLVD
jgi:redox-sensing transcriptional repressor